MKSRLLFLVAAPLAVLTSLAAPAMSQATYYNMATGDYSQDFSSITNTNVWVTPTTGSFQGLPTNATGTIPTATRITTASTNFVTGTSGGVQRGSGDLRLLSTGSTDNTSSTAIDLLLNFAGRNAGNLSFDAASVANSTGNRGGSLRVYVSTNSTTWSEISGGGLPYIATNNVAASGPVSVALPAAINDAPTVQLRFYYHNAPAGGASPSGSRPKISIDNLLVTSTSPSANAPVITSPLTASAVALEASSNIYQITASNSPDSYGASNLPEGLTVDPATGIISGTPAAPGTYSISISATNSQGTGSATLTLTVLPNPGAPTITSVLQIIAPIDVPFSYQIQASNTPTSYAATGLPTGWAIDTTTGLITGTPTSNASRNITISASNALGTDTKVLNVFTGSAPALTSPFGAAYVNVASSIQIVATGPASAYAATGLPAGWVLNSSTGLLTGTPTSTGTLQFEVTASNPLGSASGTFTLTVIDQTAQNEIPLNVVVNKYVNDATDRIQLLVIGNGSPGSTVDLRGMIIKDFSSSNANDGGGKFIFAENEVWSAVPAGTLIDLLGSGSFPETPFTDPDNFYIAARLQDATAFVNGGGAFDISTDDMIMIKAAGTGVSGVAGGIHVLCAGTAGAQFNAFLGAKLRSSATTPGGFGVYANNSTSQLANYGTSGVAASTDATGNTAAGSASMNFESWNNATNESYVKALRGIVDGTGSAVVVNGTPGSAFVDKQLFARASSGQTVRITYTAISTVKPTVGLSIEVPAEFGAPSGPNISLSGTGSSSATVDVQGQIITVSGLSLLSGNTLTVSIAGLITPDTAVPVTNTGLYSFNLQSQGEGGSLAPLGSPAEARVVIPIANVRNADPATFIPVLLGQTVAVEGVCSVGRLGTGNTNSALQDATHGVTIFSQSAVEGPQNRGHRYAVVGTVSQSNGLVRLILSDPSLVFDLGFVGDPEPVTVSVTEFNSNGLAYQSRVVRIENLNFVSGTWERNTNVILQDGSSNEVKIRIQPASTANTPPASYPVSVTGIGGQFDNSSPFDGGFELQPRDAADVTSSASINVTGAAFSAFTAAQGTPSSPQTVSVSGSNLSGDLTVTAPAGFEVSADGLNYAASVALTPSSGTVSASTISVRLTGAVAGDFSGNVSFASTGATTQNRAVSGTVSAGSAYDTWASGFELDAATTGAPGADPDGDTFTNEQEYAFGTSPIQANGSLLTTESSGGNLTVTWLERGDVTYNVQSTLNLATTAFANDGAVSVVNGPAEPTPPAGYTRKQFTVPATGAKFYRVSATTP